MLWALRSQVIAQIWTGPEHDLWVVLHVECMARGFHLVTALSGKTCSCLHAQLLINQRLTTLFQEHISVHRNLHLLGKSPSIMLQVKRDTNEIEKVDAYPQYAASALAANAFVRCTFAGE